MLATKRSVIVEVLASAIDTDWLIPTAFDLGALVRVRKIDIAALVTVLVLGVPVGQRRSIAGLRRAYELATHTEVAPSSFFERLTAALAALIKALSHRLIDSLSMAHGHHLKSAIKAVNDVLATDSTVFGDEKLHAVTNVLGTSANRIKVTDKNTHDSQAWKRIGKWIRGHLLLIDLGYYDFHLFWRIHNQEGFFLSRAKTNFNPIITASNRRHRGRSIDVVGQRLQDVLPKLKRSIFDLQVQVEVKKRVYKGVQRTVPFEMRLVGIWNEEKGRYHMYLTNLGPDELGAELAGEIYRLRWQVELMWTSLKTEGRLAQIPSDVEHVRDVLMWSSIAYVLCGRVLLDWLRGRLSGHQWVNTRLFERLFESVRLVVVWQMLAHLRVDEPGADPLLDFFLHELTASASPPATPFITAFSP